jgi:tRNA uridine 5-carbamoylmethylation protein Kti12
MIDENFVQAAVTIRRNYLKVTNTLGVYQKKAKESVEGLDDIIEKLENLKEKAKSNREMTTDMAVEDIQKIIKDFEEETTRLTSVIDPLNEQLEKLAIEEEELWRAIKLKHSDISEIDIVDYIKRRLIKENLS